MEKGCYKVPKKQYSGSEYLIRELCSTYGPKNMCDEVFVVRSLKSSDERT